MVLVSNLIEYFEFDVEGEIVEIVKAQNEIIAATLNKIGLKKVNDDYWVGKADEEEAGQQQNQEEDQTMDELEPVLLLLLEEDLILHSLHSHHMSLQWKEVYHSLGLSKWS